MKLTINRAGKNLMEVLELKQPQLETIIKRLEAASNDDTLKEVDVIIRTIDGVKNSQELAMAFMMYGYNEALRVMARKADAAIEKIEEVKENMQSKIITMPAPSLYIP